jgi:hypothetical protein
MPINIRLLKDNRFIETIMQNFKKDFKGASHSQNLCYYGRGNVDIRIQVLCYYGQGSADTRNQNLCYYGQRNVDIRNLSERKETFLLFSK